MTEPLKEPLEDEVAHARRVMHQALAVYEIAVGRYNDIIRKRAELYAQHRESGVECGPAAGRAAHVRPASGAPTQSGWSGTIPPKCET